MKITIIGAGNVGATLGKRFSEIGHEVTYGVRDPTSEEYAGRKDIRTVAEAAGCSETILLAVPYDAIENVLRECGDLSEKLIIDATNPLIMENNSLRLALGFESSGAEHVATLAPKAKVVKCFNTTGFANMASPRGSMMFVCGDDEALCQQVKKLAEEIGFETFLIGRLSKARLLEPLAMLWIHLAFTSDLGSEFAFQILKK